VLKVILGQHNKPKAAVHSAVLTGPLKKKKKKNRGHGQPKSRWIEGVEEDTWKLGCRNWRVYAQVKGRWQHLLEEARAHRGL
jgi:hypothetical protein